MKWKISFCGTGHLISNKNITWFVRIILFYFLLFSYKDLWASSFKHAEFSLLYGAGSSASIKNIIAKKQIILPRSYLAGIEYRSPSANCFPIKVDIQILKHFARQSAFELIVCPVIGTSDVFWGKVGFNWAVGNGVSGLIGKHIAFEETQGVQTRRFLNYLLLEQNMFLKENSAR